MGTACGRGVCNSNLVRITITLKHTTLRNVISPNVIIIKGLRQQAMECGYYALKDASGR
jgi:hypothetical protein